MKKILCILAAAVALSACINEDGISIKMPAALARQWMSQDSYEDESWITIWDFASRSGKVTFVTFSTLDDLDTFPQYYAYDEYFFDVECRKKGDIYTITLNDAENSKYYFTDLTSSSVTVTAEDGYQWTLTPSPRKVSAVPVDY